MAKSINCSDLGMACDFQATADTTEELLQVCGAHAATAHGMTEVSPEMMAAVNAAIREV